jgi:lipopolysaccharide biosynthesis regulator YciM
MGFFSVVWDKWKEMDKHCTSPVASCFESREPSYDWNQVIKIAETILESPNTTKEQKQKASSQLSRANSKLNY